MTATALWTPTISVGTTNWQRTDTAGVDWICEDLAGWADLPKSDAPVTNRAFDHGAWVGEGWYGPRVLILTGALAAPDRAALQWALHDLRAQHAAALAGEVELVIAELDGTRTLDVRASSPNLTVEYLSPNVARVKLELVAAWPVKAANPRSVTVAGGGTSSVGRTYPRPDARGWWTYGASGTSNDIQATNNGNAPSRPQFLITGPVTNPQIIHAQQARRLAFTITLGINDKLGVDVATHSVLLNTVANRRYVLTSDSAWFDLLPGENTLQYRSDSSTGTLRVDWSDGWW